MAIEEPVVAKKAPKEPKAKKPSALRKPRNPPTYPPYEELYVYVYVYLYERNLTPLM